MAETNKNIVNLPLEEIMGERFGRYSKYIIQDRALPDARDGLKPVQRRILYTMFSDGNTHDKAYRKSVKSVGLVIGNYHPHGDSSVYEAMVRMSQNWKTREPLIDMHGNNGSMDDDPPAAMRYTEARLAPLSQYLLNDIDKETVLFAPNFDDTNMEPTVLPARYPNLLVNGISGIAAGYATNIPPHNLSEVIDATIYRIQFPNCEVDELLEYIQGPDFPTGGIVQGREGIRDAFNTGKGRVMVRSKVETVQTKTGQQIIISELPYEVVKCNLVKKIDDIRLNKKIEGMIDVRDESDRNGLRIAIDLKKDSNAELIINYLYKTTDLQVSYNYNVVAIVNKRPMQLGLKQMLDAFINHRIDVITKRCQYDLNRMEKRCHILEGLIKAVSVLDEIIALIRSAKDKADSKNKIIEAFSFTDEQAEAIVSLRLYRLSSTDITQLKEEFTQLVNAMEALNDILGNQKLLRKEIVNELKEVKKQFGSPRLTKIEDEIEEIVIDKQQMIPSEQVMVTISRDGYIKRVSMRSYSSNDSMTGIKEGDQLIGAIEVNTLDILLYITSSGTYGYTYVHEIEEAKWKDIGSHLNSLVNMNGEEKIISAFVLSSFDTYASIVSLSSKGMIKRTMVKDLEVSRNNKTMNLMSLKEGDALVSAQVVYENKDLLIVSKDGYVARYNVETITPTAPKTKGIIAMKSSEVMISASALNNHENCVLFVCSNGSMKRLKTSDLPLNGRPVRGESIAKKVKSNPTSIDTVRIGDLNDEVTFMQDPIEKFTFKEFTLMNKESTFSTSVKLNPDFYVMKGIVKIEKIDVPETSEMSEDIQQINLDI